MEFIAIDFETATADRNSACEIGLTWVKDLVVRKTRSWLIKPKCYPYFSPHNIAVHGIHPHEVANAPDLPAFWKEFGHVFEGRTIIAHNASFDMSVLRSTLTAYGIPNPSLKYLCSYQLAKRAWPTASAYDLKTLCRMLSLDLSHHRAGDDSRAAAEVFIRAAHMLGASTFEEMLARTNMRAGEVFPGGHMPTSVVRVKEPAGARAIGGAARSRTRIR